MIRQGARKEAMLIGEYRHILDDKKRVALPASFRKELGKQVVVTRGLDNCLFVYSLAEWHKVADKLSGLSMGQADTRGFNRFMLAGAVSVEVDALGRILIPDFLKEFAGLRDRLVIVGVQVRLEIWNEKRWKEYTAKIEQQADILAEKLGEVGVF